MLNVEQIIEEIKDVKKDLSVIESPLKLNKLRGRLEMLEWGIHPQPKTLDDMLLKLEEVDRRRNLTLCTPDNITDNAKYWAIKFMMAEI